MHKRDVQDGNIYMGALFFAQIQILFNGFAEMALAIAKLPVFYKQRDLRFYPAWAYAIPSWILKIPIAIIETAIWVILTYYIIGYDSNAGRFFKHYFVLLAVHQMASALFRLNAGLGRNMILANTFGTGALVTLIVLGGFIISRRMFAFLSCLASMRLLCSFYVKNHKFQIDSFQPKTEIRLQPKSF